MIKGWSENYFLVTDSVVDAHILIHQPQTVKEVLRILERLFKPSNQNKICLFKLADYEILILNLCPITILSAIPIFMYFPIQFPIRIRAPPYPLKLESLPIF